MVRIKNILNDVSDELVNSVPRLEPGQTRTFQFLNGIKVHDAENPAVFKVEYGKFRFNLKDKIYDPYLKKTVDIGVPNIIDGDRVIDYKKFAPGEGEASFSGRFSLSGDNADEIEIFEFFMLCNRVKNNEHRNKSEAPMLELLPIIETKQTSSFSATKISRKQPPQVVET